MAQENEPSSCGCHRVQVDGLAPAAREVLFFGGGGSDIDIKGSPAKALSKKVFSSGHASAIAG